MRKRSYTVAFIGVFTALALILSYIEAMLPPLLASVPGIKMGLPNIIIIFLLYRKGWATAVGVSLVRILLVSLLFGNMMALAYSLAGGVLSLAVMILFKKLNFLSTAGVSVAGGVCHNIGQILTAMLLLETTELGYYLVVLIVTGTVSGLLIGLCGSLLVNKIPTKLTKC
ncbi:MAG: Gx transporter family protein [Clostridia bacterium]|nr:Gx transporter family protein [Clostridia bacterium]